MDPRFSTGTNTWKAGTDVVVEGIAERATGLDTLSAVAAAYLEKYDGEWRFTATEDGFDSAGDVFRVPPSKVLVFAKAPHAQTTFRF